MVEKGTQELSAAEMEFLKVRRKRILDEMQIQKAENERRNKLYFTRTDELMKENESLLAKLKTFAKKNEDMWKLCGITLGQDEGKNPFLFLEQVVPEAFKGMSVWAEKAKKAAIEEIELSGLDYGEIRKKAAKRKSSGGGLPSLVSTAEDKGKDTTEYRAKKPMRRVRA